LIDRYHSWRSVAADHAPGIRSGLGADGPRGTGTSDPTGETAISAFDRPDPVLRADRHLRDTITRAVQDLARARHDIEKILEPHAHIRKPGETKGCKSLMCDAVIETSMSAYANKSHCAACYRYMIERDVKVVPLEVVVARQRQREKRSADA
jgi:hypothetical protein